MLVEYRYITAVSGANMTRKRWAEQLEDGRKLLRETYEGPSSFDRNGVLEHAVRFTEAKAEDGNTLGTLEVTVAQSDIINRNRRIYTRKVYELAVGRSQTLVAAGKFLGEVDHPWMGTLEGAAIIWTKTWMDGAYMKASGSILKTEPGRHLKGLLDGKVGVGISTRGYGSYVTETRELEGVPVEIDIIGEDYTMEGIDAVLFESNQAGAVTSHSESTHSTNREGTVKLTLEQLRKDNPDLVAQIEAAAREGFVAQADVETQVNAAKDAAKTEGVEEGKKQALEGADVKQGLALLAVVTPVVKPTPVAEGTQDPTAKLAETLAAVQAKLDAAEAKERQQNEAAQAQAKQTAIVAKVESVLTGYEHADLLKADLLKAESVEAVDALFTEKKTFVETAIARAKVTEANKGVGTADTNTGDQQTGAPLTEAEQAVLDDINTTRRINGLKEWSTLPESQRIKA